MKNKYISIIYPRKPNPVLHCKQFQTLPCWLFDSHQPLLPLVCSRYYFGERRSGRCLEVPKSRVATVSIHSPPISSPFCKYNNNVFCNTVKTIICSQIFLACVLCSRWTTHSFHVFRKKSDNFPPFFIFPISCFPL